MNIFNSRTYRNSGSKRSPAADTVWNLFFTSILSVMLLSCASSPRFTAERHREPSASPGAGSVPAPEGKSASTKGIASYYAHDFHGKKTANGEQFDMHAMTAAHRSYPFNTKIRVTNENNGKSCVVRVNDRGPFKLDRIIDLSLGAAEKLGMTSSGTAPVTLEVIEWGN